MTLWKSRFTQRIVYPQKMVNKTFYRFVFSFIAVIAGVLVTVLLIGVGSGVQ